MYKFFLTWLLASVLLVCTGCGCNRTQKEPEPAMPGQMSLQIVPLGTFRAANQASLMIVGTIDRRPMKVKHFEILSLKIVDQVGNEVPFKMEKHPGDCSKYGPFVSLIIDGRTASETISVSGKVRYGKEVYAISAMYVAGKPDDGFFWRRKDVALTREK